MTAFKVFLEQNALEQLYIQLFFRSTVGLSKQAAKEAAHWYFSTLFHKAPANTADNWWEKAVEWAENMHSLSNSKDKNRKTLKDLAKGPVPLPLLVKGVIAKSVNQLKSRSSVNESSDLQELRFMLALRKEYKFTKEQAYEVIEWLKSEKDWKWLNDKVIQTFYDIWDPDSKNWHPGLSYDEYVMDEVHMALLTKYELHTRSLLG